jgi:cyanate permease
MVILLGFAAGAFLPLMGAIVSSWFGAAAFGRVTGLVGPFTTLAAIGPWIAGYIRDTTGSYDPAWFWLSISLLIAVAATLMLGDRPDFAQNSQARG